MGNVGSMVRRRLNRFNVESRAHRFLERDKPTAAPKFESNVQDLKRALELDPQLVDKLNKKDSQLDDRLKKVYVTSKDSYIEHVIKRKEQEGRELPLDRRIVQDFEFGFREPANVMPGRCTLRQAMKFITDHQSDPNLWSKEKIAREYKMNEDTIGNILIHFRSFQVYIPQPGVKENILTQAKSKMISDNESKQT